MDEVITVRFHNESRAYTFDPKDYRFSRGDKVIVETARGIALGEVADGNRPATGEDSKRDIRPVLRPASDDDLERGRKNAEREKEAAEVCREKIKQHHLAMNLVDVESLFDGSKLMFYFTAGERVDFRALVKDLAARFRVRIEMRQVGVRDEARIIGGLGICGQPFCCSRFTANFQPVSIKMAKEQGLSLNPSKISGNCGRLMCCLQYEQDSYAKLLEITPKTGSAVMTESGEGIVTDCNLISGMLKVKLKSNEIAPIEVHRDKVTPLRDGRGKSEKSRFEPQPPNDHRKNKKST